MLPSRAAAIIHVYSICPLLILAIHGSTTAQRLPGEVRSREGHHNHKKHNQHNQRWLPKTHHLGGFNLASSLASSHANQFNWQPKHFGRLWEPNSQFEPEMASSSSFDWRSPNRNNNRYNHLFDDSNNYLHEFFASEGQHQPYFNNHNFNRHQNHRPPMMNSDNGFNHHQHAFQGMNTFHQNAGHHQHHQQQSNNFFNAHQQQTMQQSEADYISNAGGSFPGDVGSEGNPIKGAVISHHEHKFYDVPEQFNYHEPTVVHLEGKIYPITLSWSSFSSPLMTNHHFPTEHHHEETYPREEPLSHTHISKPIFHEIREVITPYKNWYRVNRPTREHVQAYIHKHGKGDESKVDPMVHYHQHFGGHHRQHHHRGGHHRYQHHKQGHHHHRSSERRSSEDAAQSGHHERR